MSQFNAVPAPAGGQARVQHALGLPRPMRPVVIQRSGGNLLRKMADHPRVLCRGVAVAGGIGPGRAGGAGIHAHVGSVQLKRRLITIPGMDEIRPVSYTHLTLPTKRIV